MFSQEKRKSKKNVVKLEDTFVIVRPRYLEKKLYAVRGVGFWNPFIVR
jgi:hypothetical protein